MEGKAIAYLAAYSSSMCGTRYVREDWAPYTYLFRLLGQRQISHAFLESLPKQKLRHCSRQQSEVGVATHVPGINQPGMIMAIHDKLNTWEEAKLGL